MPTVVNSIQSDAPFPKYSTSIMIRENFRENENFRELKFCENCPIFAKMEKCIFVSILVGELMVPPLVISTDLTVYVHTAHVRAHKKSSR
jgi:hypothetical protein